MHLRSPARWFTLGAALVAAACVSRSALVLPEYAVAGDPAGAGGDAQAQGGEAGAGGDTQPQGGENGDPPPGDSPWAAPGYGPFATSVALATKLTVTVAGELELAFDPADGGTIDTWHDLALDPGRAVNLASGEAYNDYDGLFFQRVDVEAAWRPQGKDTSAAVELLATNAVRTVVHVSALLNAPTLDMTVRQRYVIVPTGALRVQATYTAVDAVTPLEINYGLSVANAASTGLTWVHATADEDPLPLRVSTPAPAFIFHHAPLGGGVVFTALTPLPALPAGSLIFGVYDLANVEYIYYIEPNRPFAAGESLTRELQLLLKPTGTTDSLAVRPRVDDALTPPTVSVLLGGEWRENGAAFSAADAAALALADPGGARLQLAAGGLVRFAPLFRIGRWPAASGAAEVRLDGVVQASGRDYHAALEPVARAVYFDGVSGELNLAHGGLVGNPDEQLADAATASPLTFDHDNATLLLAFASPVSGVHLTVDPRASVSDALLVWEYLGAGGWTALAVTATPATAAGLTGTGQVVFAVPADWRALALTGAAPLYPLRLRRQTSASFDPPVALRTVTSDVLDLQLYRDVDRDLVLELSP